MKNGKPWFVLWVVIAAVLTVQAAMAQDTNQFPGQAKWLNVDGSKARLNKEMQSASFFGTKRVTVKYDDISTWPVYEVRELSNEKPTGKTCPVQAYICFFVIRDGVLTGGQFEYLRPNHQETKFVHRLTKGFIPEIKPIPGEKCFFGILSMDLQECSNLAEAVWPGSKTGSPEGTPTVTNPGSSGTQNSPGASPSSSPTETAGSGDYPANVDWKKVNGSKAKVNQTLHSAKFSKNIVKFSYDSLTGWPVKSIKLTHGPGNADSNAFTCIFVMRNGRLTGGKFDWLRVGQTAKDLSNIHSGYVDGVKPESGEVCYFSLVSIDGKQSTNLVEGRWP